MDLINLATIDWSASSSKGLEVKLSCDDIAGGGKILKEDRKYAPGPEMEVEED